MLRCYQIHGATTDMTKAGFVYRNNRPFRVAAMPADLKSRTHGQRAEREQKGEIFASAGDEVETTNRNVR